MEPISWPELTHVYSLARRDIWIRICECEPDVHQKLRLVNSGNWPQVGKLLSEIKTIAK